MEYKIEPIGAEFSSKDLAQLSAHFTANAEAGYVLHSVFQAQQPSGCLGIGGPTITYFAIYVRR